MLRDIPELEERMVKLYIDLSFCKWHPIPTHKVKGSQLYHHPKVRQEDYRQNLQEAEECNVKVNH